MTGTIPSERQIQREILRMMGSVFPAALCHHSPNGAHLGGDSRARAMQMAALRRDGLKPGFLDLIVLWNHGVGFLEVKRPKGGKLSDAQKRIHALLADMGHRIAVTTSAYEAQAILLDWGVPASAARWRDDGGQA